MPTGSFLLAAMSLVAAVQSEAALAESSQTRRGSRVPVAVTPAELCFICWLTVVTVVPDFRQEKWDSPGNQRFYEA